MGWRERDWAKFTDDEWRRIVGPRADAVTTTTTLGGSGRATPRHASTSRWAPRVTTVTLLAAVVTLLATTLGLLLHLRMTLHVPGRSPTPAHTIGIHWRPSDLVPASTAGQICVSTPPTGRVCASYAPGERPADALTAQLHTAGISLGG